VPFSYFWYNRNKVIIVTDKILKPLLIALAVMNAVDYAFTVRAIRVLGVPEANPLISVSLGTPLFAVIKLIVIPLLCYLLWRSRHKWKRMKPLICGLLVFVTAAYAVVTIWHFYGQFLM
jgi:hypothetical protein